MTNLRTVQKVRGPTKQGSRTFGRLILSLSLPYPFYTYTGRVVSGPCTSRWSQTGIATGLEVQRQQLVGTTGTLDTTKTEMGVQEAEQLLLPASVHQGVRIRLLVGLYEGDFLLMAKPLAV